MGKFKKEDDALKAVNDLNNRWFGGRPVYAELTPVTDFREACCRQYETGECTRSGFCNFMHLKPISRKLRHDLYGRNDAGRWGGEHHSMNRDRGGGGRGGGGGWGRDGQMDLKDELEMESRGGRRDRDKRRSRSRSRGRRSRSRDRSGRY